MWYEGSANAYLRHAYILSTSNAAELRRPSVSAERTLKSRCRSLNSWMYGGSPWSRTSEANGAGNGKTSLCRNAADSIIFRPAFVRRRAARRYFLTPPASSAAVAFELGGALAVSGGECAPAASRGFASATTGGTNGPGSAHGGVATGGGTSFIEVLRLCRYRSAS